MKVFATEISTSVNLFLALFGREACDIVVDMATASSIQKTLFITFRHDTRQAQHKKQQLLAQALSERCAQA